MNDAHAVWLPVLLLAATLAQAQSPAPEIVEVGPHHRVWQTVSIAPDERGEMVQSESSYTEIATGLNWWNPKSETWEETVEAFEILPQGHAVARRGPHKVIIAGNINDGGAVDVELPDGRRMLSNPMGLSYFDASTGRSVLLAEVKDCVGELIEPNVILFADAFDTIKAALSYTYRRGQFEQDVVIYQDPGPPEDWGLIGATTMLEIYTEVFEAPEPRVLVEGGEVDSESPDPTLDFGSMRMEQGTAYFLHRQMEDVPMRKLWHQIEGRQFLIERIPYRDVEPLLRQLDARADPPSSSWLAGRTSGSREGIARLLTPRRAGLELAAIARSHAPLEPGVVLDYLSLNSTQTNQVFRGDETYYCSGLVNLYGTTVIEGGTCVKYANTNSAELRFNGSVQFQTSAYRPAVFTARDDDSVGQTISGSSGNPAGSYAPYALRFYALSSPAIIEHLRVAYAGHGMVLYAPSGHVVRHAQFVNCGTPIGATGNSFTVQNALLHNAATNGFNLLSGAAATGEHLTLHRVARVVNAASVLALTNSLLVGVTNWTYSFSGASNATNSSSAVFQQVGAGAHYLAAGSPHRNTGTTNLTVSLAKELKGLTTYPPNWIGTTVNSDTVLNPVAQRDSDVPDVGYHYAPLDYLASNVVVSASLTLANGVAVGVLGTTGFQLQPGGRILGEGTPTALNRLAGFQNVQEQPLAWGGSKLILIYGGSSGHAMDFRFTDVSLNPGYVRPILDSGTQAFGSLSFQHSQLRGGSLYLYPNSASSVVVGLTNNLIDRCNFYFQHYYYSQNTPLAVYLYNNLFRAGSLGIDYSTGTSNPYWYIRDNLFDGATITTNGTAWTTYVQRGFNGFSSGVVNTLGGSANVTGLVPDFQPGPLGQFYYPSSGGGTSLTNLFNAGSRSADTAGLFHFVTRIDQLKQGTNQVDIGYHYVALEPDTEGLVGHWKLDENTGTVAADSSGYGHSGGLVNSPSWVTGQLGSALSFSTDKYVSVPASTLHSLGSTDFTISAWVKPSSSGTVIAKGGGSQASSSEYILHVNSQGFFFRGTWRTSSALSVTTGVWSQVAIAYTASNQTLRFYKNGAQISSTVVSGSYATDTSHNLFISRQGTSVQNNLQGTADDIRIYRRALSAVEVTSLFNLATWDYDGDGQPDYLEDRNGNGSVDTGEKDWRSRADPGLRTQITRPKDGSSIP